MFATVLARVAVTGEEVPTVELDFLPGQFGIGQHADDARHSQVKTNRTNPVVLGWFKLSLEGAKLGPIFKIVRYITTIFDVNHFGDGAMEIVLLEE